MRAQPSSSFTTIVSIAMIAAATRRPSERVSGPSVMRGGALPLEIIGTKAASQSGDLLQSNASPPSRDRRVSNLLQVIERAIKTDKHLLVAGIDRAGWCYDILAYKSIENVTSTDSQGSDAVIGKLNKDTFSTLTEDVDLFYSGNVQQILAQTLCLPGEQAKR